MASCHCCPPPAVQLGPSTQRLGLLGLSTSSGFIQTASPQHWQRTKEMLCTSGSPEREWAAQNHGFLLVRRDHLRTEAAHVLLSHESGVWANPSLRNCFKKQKKLPPSQGLMLQGLTTSLAFGSCVFPSFWPLLLWVTVGELPNPKLSKALS